MNSSDFIVLFLYEWKSNYNVAAASRNISATFVNGFLNERTIRRWYIKFETGDEGLINEDRGRPKTVAVANLLRGFWGLAYPMNFCKFNIALQVI